MADVICIGAFAMQSVVAAGSAKEEDPLSKALREEAERMQNGAT